MPSGFTIIAILNYIYTTDRIKNALTEIANALETISALSFKGLNVEHTGFHTLGTFLGL